MNIGATLSLYYRLMKITITTRKDNEYSEDEEVIVQQPKEFDSTKVIKIWDYLYDIIELQQAIEAVQKYSNKI